MTARSKYWRRLAERTALTCLVAAGAVTQAFAQGVDAFYQGKTITLVVSAGPGGPYDLHARLLSRHFGRHIPGKPNVVVTHMPGAGGALAVNNVGKAAPQDGTVLGNILNTFPLAQILGSVQSGVSASSLQWIGNMTAEVHVAIAWHAAPARSIEEAKRTELIMGATSPGTLGDLYPRIANHLLGTKFRVVTGYKEFAAIDIAMERGEVHGRAGEPWYGWDGGYSSLLRQRKVGVLFQVGRTRARDLLNEPLLSDLANSSEERSIVEIFGSPAVLGKPTVAGPGVPADRVEALRKAYVATMFDPEFNADARRAGFPLAPVGGKELQTIVDRIMTTPASIVERAKGAIRN